MALENQVTFAEVGNPKRVTQLTENTDAAGAYFLTEKVGESAAKKTSYATVESAVKSKVQGEYLQTLSATPASNKTMSEKLVVGELKKRDDKIVQLEQGESIYNVTAKVPLASGSYYTAATARAAVPTGVRKLGLVITYQTSATAWVTEQFFQGAISAWTTATNWKSFGAGGNITLTYTTDVATTRKLVPVSDRKQGAMISYYNGTELITEQYKHTIYTDTEWVKDTNWIRIADYDRVINAKKTTSSISSIYPFVKIGDIDLARNIIGSVVDMQITTNDINRKFFIKEILLGNPIRLVIHSTVDDGASSRLVAFIPVFNTDEGYVDKFVANNSTSESVYMRINADRFKDINNSKINTDLYDVNKFELERHKFLANIDDFAYYKRNLNCIDDNYSYDYGALLLDKCIQELRIIGEDVTRFYYVEQFVNADHKIEVVIASAQNADLTENIKREAVLSFSPRPASGIVKKDIKGYSAALIGVSINVEEADNIRSFNLDVYAPKKYRFRFKTDTTAVNNIIPLMPRCYTTSKDATYSFKSAFKEVLFGNSFITLENNEKKIIKGNAGCSFIAPRDSTYHFSAFVASKTNQSSTSIANNVDFVKSPYLPNIPFLNSNLYKYSEDISQDYIHPEIIDTVSGVGGYRYWMIASTFPAANDAYEDELIFVSNNMTDWKRIKGNDEPFDESIHASGICLPPHALTSSSDNRYYQFLPFPRVDVIEVNGEMKTISKGWSHDPTMTYSDGYVYFYITRNMKFAGDSTPETPPYSNQFNILIRTNDGVNWESVRGDGSSYKLLTPDASLKLFSQTDGKNNYLRHRDHQDEECGPTFVKMGSEWWLLHGKNGGVIYKGNSVYSVDFSNGLKTNNAYDNHPSHFVHDSKLFRWDGIGLSEFNTLNNTFELKPYNPFFTAELETYKKSIFPTLDGGAIFAVADNLWSYFDLLTCPDIFTTGGSLKMVVGKIKSLNTLISGSESIEDGCYWTTKAYVPKNDKVHIFRNPLIKNTTASPNKFQKILLYTITLKKGERVDLDVQINVQGNCACSISDIIVVEEM